MDAPATTDGKSSAAAGDGTEAELSSFAFESPIGRLWLGVRQGSLRRLTLRPEAPLELEGPEEGRPLCHEAYRQVDAYLGGRLREFDLPLLATGSEFQRQVWTAMAKIPYGRTRSYGELAREIANPGATRAVGSACGANPIPLIIPCHRVLAAAGRLGGFGLGRDTKRWLLDLETYGRPGW